MRARSSSWLLLSVVLGVASLAAACQGNAASPPGDDAGAPAPPPAVTPPADDTGDVDAGAVTIDDRTITSVEVTPSAATIDVHGAPLTTPFALVAHYADGTKGALVSGVSWTATNPQIGRVDATGAFAAAGTIGGSATVTATIGKLTASAALTVKLHVDPTPAAAATSTVRAALAGATTNDPAVVWTYPYDATVFPRGPGAPTLMWNGGAASDVYLVHLASATFELRTFVTGLGAAAQLPIDPATWSAFVESTEGAATLDVARYDGTHATVIAHHGWRVAGGSMRGSIYYWAQQTGRVVRIKNGGAPEDFANKAPLTDTSKYPATSCLMTCHTVSADGSTLVSGGGSFAGSYSLKTAAPIYSLGGVWGGSGGTVYDAKNIAWASSALSPNGAYLVTNALSAQLSEYESGPSVLPAMYRTKDGSAVTTSGLTERVYMPAFSPDGKSIVYVAGTADAIPAGKIWTDNTGAGGLRVVDFDDTKPVFTSAPRDVVGLGADPKTRYIAWPTVTPDGSYAVYARSDTSDSETVGANRGDLYIANLKTGDEVRLANLDGDGYPFAAGDRDRGVNFEPAFAPVSAGGYFWVVFASRRTYGNALTGARTTTKQLWIAAIDQHPLPGKDPSHPPFRLSGQSMDLNLRGYWALDPCKGDGVGCASGTECCGGYCGGSGGPGGAPVCTSEKPACATDGDACTTTSDCCDAAAGATCINRVCSAPPPK